MTTHEVHGFDWFSDRLEVARWISDAPGKRDAFFNCPVHGGSDSLHIEEKGGRTVVYCFAEQCKYGDIVATLDDSEDRPWPHLVKRSDTRSVRRRPPVDATADPLGWYAAYCGVPRALLDTLPISAKADGWVSHDFPGLGVAKLRQAGTSERRWHPEGSHNPAVWPLDDSMPADMLLTEGETDAIALRGIGYDMAYSGGSASGVPSVSDFRSMARRGVRSVFVAYDADEPGQKGAAKAMENAMAAGLFAARIVPPDYDSLTGTGKDWREWVLAGGDQIPDSNISQVVKPIKQIVDETPDTVPWIAYPIAYSGGVTVVAGPPKGGKSTLLGHLARCAESGEQFLGRFGVRKGTPVLLMTEEYGVPVVTKTKAFGISGIDVVQRSDAVRAGWGLADSLAGAARWLSTHPRAVVIIDTLAVWAGIENENDAAETTAAIETIRHALADRDAGVILVHHTRKGGGIAGEATRGSGAIAASCDVQAELTYFDPSDPLDSRRRLTVRGRILETTSMLVDYDTSAHAYSVVDTSEEDNAELRSWIEGIPRATEAPEGMSKRDLDALWGINGAKRIKRLLGLGLLSQSEDLVKVGRGRERRYWRSDIVISHRRTDELPQNRDESIGVEDEAGGTTPKGGSHVRGTDEPTNHRYRRSSVHRSDEGNKET